MKKKQVGMVSKVKQSRTMSRVHSPYGSTGLTMSRFGECLFYSLKCFTFIFLLLLVSGTSFLLRAEERLTLKQCYDDAVKRMETVAISEVDINRAKTRYLQALGGVIPQISINAQEFLQDDHAQGNTATAAGNVANTFTRFSTPQVAVTLTQNLFRGFKEFNALKLTHWDRELQKANLANVERLLFADVATAFYTVAKIELDIQTSQKIIRVIQVQIGDLKKRVDLGKSRESEQMAQETDLALLEADLVKKKGDLLVAYDMLSFLTGLDPQPPIDAREPVERQLNPVEKYQAQAESRPDIQAAKDTYQISKGKVAIARGDLLPYANAQANFYPYRVGFRKDIFWDASFNLNIPVFNLTTWGTLKESKLEAKQADLQAQLTRRQAMTDVKKAYDSYQHSLVQYKKYQFATRKAEESYQKQVEDFNLSLITNFDVLQSQRTLLTALRERDTAKAQVWAYYAGLIVTIGALP